MLSVGATETIKLTRRKHASEFNEFCMTLIPPKCHEQLKPKVNLGIFFPVWMEPGKKDIGTWC